MKSIILGEADIEYIGRSDSPLQGFTIQGTKVKSRIIIEVMRNVFCTLWFLEVWTSLPEWVGKAMLLPVQWEALVCEKTQMIFSRADNYHLSDPNHIHMFTDSLLDSGISLFQP